MQRIAKWLASWIGWLELRSRWSELRALGQSPLVRASVLMPAFGYILLLNDNVHQYLTIKYDGWLLQYLPSLWRVWLLFYGTFALAIASIIFSRFCPTEIKRYVSAFAMVDAEREHSHHPNRTEEIRRQLRDLYEGMSKWEGSIFPYKLKLHEPDLGIQWSDILSGTLLYRWILADIKRPVLRIITLLIFAAGLTLLAVPAMFTFLQVTVLLLGHM